METANTILGIIASLLAIGGMYYTYNTRTLVLKSNLNKSKQSGAGSVSYQAQTMDIKGLDDRSIVTKKGNLLVSGHQNRRIYEIISKGDKFFLHIRDGDRKKVVDGESYNTDTETRYGLISYGVPCN